MVASAEEAAGRAGAEGKGRKAMSVEECFRGIRDIATDADGSSLPTIKARIDRFAAELQSSELDGRSSHPCELVERP
jgi:hypothetical protein